MALTQDVRHTIAENIRARRKALGMTQAALSEAIEVNQSYLSRLERGEDSPNFERLVLLCRALQTTPNELIGFPGE